MAITETAVADDLRAARDELDTVDPTERDLHAELGRLLNAAEDETIAAEDFERIADYWLGWDRGESKQTTQISHLSNLRTAAKRIRTARTDADSLATAEPNDIKRLMAAYKSGTHPAVGDDGIIPNPHQSTLRTFYRWHTDLPLPQSAEPHEDIGDLIEIDSDYDGREFGPEDPWRQEDVDAWLAATHGSGEGFRDRAIFALALATGQRIDAIGSLRLKHIDDTGPTMDLSLNEEEGNLKGADGTRAVLWAKNYLRPWLENHPFKGDDEAGLFVPLPGRGMNRKPDGGERDPLGGETIRDIVRKYAETAGIERPTYFHILRKTAITRMVLEDNLGDQKIKHIAGWDEDSSQFSTYLSVADSLMNDSVREDLGMPTSDVDQPVIGRPTLDRCPNCGEMFEADCDQCPNPTCRQPLTHGATDEDAGTGIDTHGLDPETAEAVLGFVAEYEDGGGQIRPGDMKAFRDFEQDLADDE